MKYNDILLSLFKQERDIYQEAKLFHQNRHNLNDKIINLKCVKCDSMIEKKGMLSSVNNARASTQLKTIY